LGGRDGPFKASFAILRRWEKCNYEKKKSLEISKKIVSCSQQKKKIFSLTSLALEFL
jgi:hypothetical protein